MNKRIINKVVLLIISIICLIKFDTANATELGKNVYLERGEQGFYSIQRWNGSQWMYIIHSITNYTDENGVKRVAYCVSPDLTGIGYVEGEFEGYEVMTKELLSDERLWRIYINGYPYKSPEELGVECEEDAYLATKQAGFCIIRGYSIDYIRENFRAGQDPVSGENLEDISRRGQKIIDAICNLVDIGYNGPQRKDDFNQITIEKKGEIEENDDYISQEYKVLSKASYAEYKVKDLKGFPDGTYVTDTNGNKKSSFIKGEHFKIVIPKKNIKESIEGTISFKFKQKDYPILYSECTSGNYQNYVLCTDEYSYDNEFGVKVKLDIFKSKIKIIKVDKVSKNPISGIKFSVRYKESKKEIGNFETDEKGEITIEKLRPGQIEIKEIDDENSIYSTNEEITSINLGFDEEKEITIENELKKASIRIIKVDNDNNEVRIPDVKFEITNSKGEKVADLVTDQNGEALIEKLPINDEYTIREIETNSSYELSDKQVTIKLNENEIKTITFKNKKKYQAAKLPRTGNHDFKIDFLKIAILASTLFIRNRKHF